MNKNEYIDILKDYLKTEFDNHESEDILRDIEEIFYEGLRNGKNEEDIIKDLGSPREFVIEIKRQEKSSKQKDYKKIFLIKVKSLFLKIKSNLRKLKEKILDMKNTNNQDEQNSSENKNKIMVYNILIIFKNILFGFVKIIFIFIVIMFIGGFCLSALMSFLLSIFILFVFAIQMKWALYFFIFVFLMSIGLIIFLIQILIFLIKSMRIVRTEISRGVENE